MLVYWLRPTKPTKEEMAVLNQVYGRCLCVIREHQDIPNEVSGLTDYIAKHRNEPGGVKKVVIVDDRKWSTSFLDAFLKLGSGEAMAWFFHHEDRPLALFERHYGEAASRKLWMDSGVPIWIPPDPILKEVGESCALCV